MIRNRISYWYPIAKSFRDYLDGLTDEDGNRLLDDYPISVGSRGAGKQTYPCVEIIFKAETGIDLPSPREGAVNLWVYVYVKDSSKEPQNGYEKQDEIQQIILNSLQGRSLPEYIYQNVGVIGTAIDIDSIDSDTDLNRPVMLARINVYVGWKQP